jgi:UDPglucose 6-dehydrogenase
MDLHVLAVVQQVARSMNGYKVIVNKSTVPVGTAAKVREVVRRETTHPFSVVSNPEFLKQGAAIEDFMKPDRVVIGTEDPRSAELMKERRAVHPHRRADPGDGPPAPSCRNTRPTRSWRRDLAHERIANVCELFRANVDLVRKAIGSDRRIGSSFLFPGVGYGGSCFPKDVKALLHFG